MKNGGDTDRGAQNFYGLNSSAGFAAISLKEDMIQTRQLAQQMRRDAGAGDMRAEHAEYGTAYRGYRSSSDPEIARDFSNVGPMVRASGHAQTPAPTTSFVGYGLLPMEVHSECGCDVISRLKVRGINEVFTPR